MLSFLTLYFDQFATLPWFAHLALFAIPLCGVMAIVSFLSASQISERERLVNTARRGGYRERV